MAIGSSGGIAQTYTTADTDGSGGLGVAETSALRATLTASGPLGQALARSGGLSASFASLDRNGSGEIDRNEFASGMASLSGDVANVLLAVQEQRESASSIMAGLQADAYRDLSESSARVVRVDIRDDEAPRSRTAAAEDRVVAAAREAPVSSRVGTDVAPRRRNTEAVDVSV